MRLQSPGLRVHIVHCVLPRIILLGVREGVRGILREAGTSSRSVVQPLMMSAALLPLLQHPIRLDFVEVDGVAGRTSLSPGPVTFTVWVPGQKLGQVDQR